jgi:hypothetical protein
MDIHSHIFLHPYNETLWNDQVLKEPLAYRTVRAVNHARTTLLSGFTLLRDLGTEGAGFSDLAIKRAIEEGLIAGPRLLTATKAIVATASYAPGPLGFAENVVLPKGRKKSAGCRRFSKQSESRQGPGLIGLRYMRISAAALAALKYLHSRAKNCARWLKNPIPPDGW